MSQENDPEMRTEYDIRGGVRGKYFRQYIEARLCLLDSPWVRLQNTESTGEHAEESTIRISGQPIYQTPRIEVGSLVSEAR